MLGVDGACGARPISDARGARVLHRLVFALFPHGVPTHHGSRARDLVGTPMARDVRMLLAHLHDHMDVVIGLWAVVVHAHRNIRVREQCRGLQALHGR